MVEGVVGAWRRRLGVCCTSIKHNTSIITPSRLRTRHDAGVLMWSGLFLAAAEKVLPRVLGLARKMVVPDTVS